jgi:hypothetical protein
MRDVAGLLAVLAAGAAYTLWRLYRYPGGWTYAFSPRHSADRADLDQARDTVRTLAREKTRELAAARAQVDRAERQHRTRIRDLEREISALRQPGPGPRVTQFGDLTLHEHAVSTQTRQIPLTGLKIRLDHAQHQHFLHLTPPDGQEHFERYPRSEYEEDDVRRFAIRLEDAVAEESVHRARAAALIKQKEHELTQARTDTSLQKQAHEHLQDTAERHRHDTRHLQATTDLETAHDHWHHLTGKRPHH